MTFQVFLTEKLGNSLIKRPIVFTISIIGNMRCQQLDVVDFIVCEFEGNYVCELDIRFQLESTTVPLTRNSRTSFPVASEKR